MRHIKGAIFSFVCPFVLENQLKFINGEVTFPPSCPAKPNSHLCASLPAKSISIDHPEILGMKGLGLSPLSKGHPRGRCWDSLLPRTLTRQNSSIRLSKLVNGSPLAHQWCWNDNQLWLSGYGSARVGGSLS